MNALFIFVLVLCLGVVITQAVSSGFSDSDFFFFFFNFVYHIYSRSQVYEEDDVGGCLLLYPITSTALWSSRSSRTKRVIGSHKLSLAMILTLSKPLLSRV